MSEPHSPAAHLVIGDWSLSVVGQFHQCAQVSPQVRLTANQQHLSVGTELLDLTLPLGKAETDRQSSDVTREMERTFYYKHI